jgi:acetylornithine/N-succinyldiaminopimelate aminotransferase
MNTDEIKHFEKEHVMQSYGRFEVVIDKGKGCAVFDKEGKKYLDFIGGLATCSVGHGNKEVAKAVYEQAKKLVGVSNLYYMEPQVVLAKKLSELSGFKKCFFCNSGAEANEAAIKLAKKFTGKKEFIAFKNSFHGRTTGSLAATWKVKYREAFTPLAPDVHFVAYNDIEALKEMIDEKTAGVIIEPIQGEAGIIVPSFGFLKKVKEVCEEKKVLMIVDEVQTGCARTGKFFAYQSEDMMPDIVTTAKGLANGIPIGVCLSNLEFDKGDHGSTFGGNNISSIAALATIEFIEKNNLAKNAEDVGNYFMQRLKDLSKKKKIIKEVRGKGLIVGVELNEDRAKEIVNKSLENGLLCNAAAENVLRFLPPLIITKKDVDKCIRILNKAF